MVWFIIAVILLLIGVGMIAVALANGGDGTTLGFVPIVVAGLLMSPACLYSQDAGEVVVLKNMGGSIAGYSADAGFHGKLPWQSTVKYDTRNNVISYVAKGKEDYDGGSARGPQVTVNDKNGAQADIDIQVNYSLDPKYAMDLYKDYGKQTTFVKSVAAVDVRSVPREVSGRFDTIQLLTDRSKYTAAIQKTLTAKWKDMGLRVEQVSVQEVRYPQSITSKYAEAQAAEIDKQKALNEQEVEKTKAETKRIKAQGEADANKVLNDSLTDNVLRQHYIDALQNADQLIVTPEGSNTLVQPK
jgi:regulator of protease activity HflC (stomatin/prohibitin superfamily)